MPAPGGGSSDPRREQVYTASRVGVVGVFVKCIDRQQVHVAIMNPDGSALASVDVSGVGRDLALDTRLRPRVDGGWL